MIERWAFIGILICFLAPGVAQEPQLGSLEWFDARLKAPQTPTQLDGYYIEFTERKWPVEGDDATLEELRARVDGRPEHPDRRTLERLEKQIELDGFLWRYRIWHENGRHWRVSIDTDDPDVFFAFHDTAMADSGASWTWLRDSLTIMDSNALPEGRNPGSSLTHLSRFVRQFVDVSISTQRPSVAAIESRIDGILWFGVAESDDKSRRIRYEGRIGDIGSSIDVQSAIHADHPDKGFIGFERQYSGWYFNNALGRRVPSVISDRSKSGDAIGIYELISVRRLRDGEITSFTRVPDAIAGTDAVRDASVIREVVDRRPGRGIVTNAISGEVVGELPSRGTGSALGSFYWLSWIVAGLLFGGIIRVRMKR